MNFAIYLLIGAFSGTLAGLLGLGGGVIVVPALAAVFLHYQIVPNAQVMHMAIGTSLATIVVTFIATVIMHYKRESIRWDYVKQMACWLFLGAIMGSLVAKHLPTHFLRIFFSIFLFCVAAKLLLSQVEVEGDGAQPLIVIIIVAIVTGILSGILGVGGGVVLIPFFLRCRLDMRQATGTSVACGLIISIVAAFSFMLFGLSSIHIPWTTGYIYWPAFLGIAISSILFAPLGANIAYRLPKEWLSRILAVFLILIGIEML